MNKYISLICHLVRMGITIALTFILHVIKPLVTLRVQGLFNIICKFYPQNQQVPHNTGASHDNAQYYTQRKHGDWN